MLAAVLVAQTAVASLVPSGMTVSVPAGSNNGARDGLSVANAFIDDAFLETSTFGGGTFRRDESDFVEVIYANVFSGRSTVNAEYGDQDTGSDGCPNPFVKAELLAEGDPLPPELRESIDPQIQDPAIVAAFGCFSLVEGVDGEGGSYSIDLVFAKGLVDNDPAADQAPEVLFFERGVNSDFDVQAIVGGTRATPQLASNTVSVLRGDLWSSPYFINTIEIDSAQRLGVVGIDLSDFFPGGPQPVYGLRVTSTNGSGADLYGQFFAALDGSQYRDLPSGLADPVVPEPGSLVLLGIAVATQFCRRSRGRRAWDRRSAV